MSDKPRRFWQIHLSTALILSLCAGAILALNLHRDAVAAGLYYHGWPFRCYQSKTLEFSFGGDAPEYNVVMPDGVSRNELFLNICVAALLLATVGIVAEYLIRRRTKP